MEVNFQVKAGLLLLLGGWAPNQYMFITGKRVSLAVERTDWSKEKPLLRLLVLLFPAVSWERRTLPLSSSQPPRHCLRGPACQGPLDVPIVSTEITQKGKKELRWIYQVPQRPYIFHGHKSVTLCHLRRRPLLFHLSSCGGSVFEGDRLLAWQGCSSVEIYGATIPSKLVNRNGFKKIRLFFSFLVTFIYCTNNTTTTLKERKGEGGGMVGYYKCHLRQTALSRYVNIIFNLSCIL